MTDAFQKYPFSRDDVVLDIGSNAGIFGLTLSSRVKECYSIELDPAFCMQAEYLRFIMKDYHEPERHHIINDDIFQRSDLFSKSTVILASKVFYHKNLMGQQDLLKSLVFHSRLKGIIIQGHTTQGQYGQLPFMNDLVGSNFLRTIYENPHHEYPLIAAVKQ